MGEEEAGPALAVVEAPQAEAPAEPAGGAAAILEGGLFAGMESRAVIIATFLAVLELLKQGVARCRQVERHGEIMIYRVEDEGRPAGEGAGNGPEAA